MTTESRPDSELLAAARTGDSRAFAEVYDRHKDRVFRQALRATQIRADAEDVTAVVFLEAWRNVARLRIVDGSALPWLLVTATNVSRNLNRASRRYREALDQLPRTEDRNEPTGTSSELQDALQRLSETEQKLLVLTLEGYSTAEAAAAVGLSPGAARTRLSRAKHRLRKQLSQLNTQFAVQGGSR